MKHIFARCAAGLILTASTCLGTAQVTENILVMGEDADEGYIPCNSRAFKAVRDSLANKLGDRGFRVYDETAVTLGSFERGRCRRNDAELIDIARSVKRSPIDVVVIFSVYARANLLDYTTKVNARVEGRMLAVHSGKRLGSEEAKRNWNVSTACKRECVVESVRKNAGMLGQDLGAVLADKLSGGFGGSGGMSVARSTTTRECGDRTREYTLEFENFTGKDFDTINRYLVQFRCYEEHRPIESRPTYASYSYHSRIAPTKLSANLHKMLELMQKNSGNAFSTTTNMNGNTYTVRKVVRRNVRPGNKKEEPFQW